MVMLLENRMHFFVFALILLVIIPSSLLTNPMKCNQISVDFWFEEYGRFNASASAIISVYLKDKIQYASISNFTCNIDFTSDAPIKYCVSDACNSDFSKPLEIPMKNTTFEVEVFYPTYSFGLFDVSIDDENFYDEDGTLFTTDTSCIIDPYNQSDSETSTTQCCLSFASAPQAVINTPKCIRFISRSSILNTDDNYSIAATSTMNFTLANGIIIGNGTIQGSAGHEFIASYDVQGSTCHGSPNSNIISCSPYYFPNNNSDALIRMYFYELIGNNYQSSADGMVGRILLRDGQTLMEEGKPFTAKDSCFYYNYPSELNPDTQVIVNSLCCVEFENS